MPEERRQMLRHIPAVDRLLNTPVLVRAAARYPRFCETDHQGAGNGNYPLEVCEIYHALKLLNRMEMSIRDRIKIYFFNSSLIPSPSV